MDSTLNTPTRANVEESELAPTQDTPEESAGENVQPMPTVTQSHRTSSCGHHSNSGPTSAETKAEADKAAPKREWVDVVCDIYNATSRVESAIQYARIQQEGSVPTRRELKLQHSILRPTLKNPLEMGGVEQHAETPPRFHQCTPCEKENRRTEEVRTSHRT